MLTELTGLTDGAPPAALQAALEERLAGADRAWLHEALAEAEAEAWSPEPANRPQWSLPTWETRFAEAGRHCHPAQAGPSGTPGPGAQDLADAARVLLLHAVRADHATATRLYTQGTAASAARSCSRCRT